MCPRGDNRQSSSDDPRAERGLPEMLWVVSSRLVAAESSEVTRPLIGPGVFHDCSWIVMSDCFGGLRAVRPHSASSARSGCQHARSAARNLSSERSAVAPSLGSNDPRELKTAHERGANGFDVQAKRLSCGKLTKTLTSAMSNPYLWPRKNRSRFGFSLISAVVRLA
jgi:hypothetical protein